MRKIFLIAVHHVRQIAFWKPFWLSLLFAPPLVVLGASVMGWLMNGNPAQDVNAVVQQMQTQITQDRVEVQTIGYVDDSGILESVPDAETYQHFARYANQEDAQRALEAKQIAGFFWIPPNYLKSGRVTYYTPERSNGATNDALMERWLVWNLAQGEGALVAQRVLDPLHIVQDETAARFVPSDFEMFTLTRAMSAGFGIAGIFVLALLLAGNVLLTPLVREREGRIMDVVLGSVSPAQFLSGKFLGALVICGMQFASWFGWSLIFNRGQPLPLPDATTGLTLGALALAGFLTYAALFALLGARVELYAESSRIPLVVGGIALLPLLGLLLNNARPQDDAAVLWSLVPLFAPTVMVWRVLVAPVPWNQVAASIGLMVLSTMLLLWLAIRWFERGAMAERGMGWGRRAMWKKILAWGAALLWLATVLYFALFNDAEPTWADLFVALLSATATWAWIATHHNIFTAWRVLGLLALALGLLVFWLQWQAALWDTALRSVNAVCVLLALDAFGALLAVWLLLLIRRDASVWALAIAWVGCPLGLLLSMSQVATFDGLENLPLDTSSVMLAGMCLLGFLALGGTVAFGAHLLRLFYLELAGKA
ncbi:MAG: ABC transporter permease [Chloroflexi bacterium]|nr:ABC transporter permease [Chloroflexota bacterium]